MRDIKKKCPHRQAVFKFYHQHQGMLLPPSLEELIDVYHPVRTVSEIADKLDISANEAKYKGGGASSFRPRMMLKLLIHSYMTNIYSSRKMECALKENIHFMWLSAMQRPDHNTLNRFRSGVLKGVLREVFSQIVLLLAEEGLLDLKVGYTDGTKLESVANKYTFVWAKGIKTSKERIKKQLGELLDYAQGVAQEELKDLSEETFQEVDAENVAQTIERIDDALADKPVAKKVKQKLGYAKKHWPGKLQEYAQKERVLNGRNSYSKTDPDATFMRMKDDHMGNGQLKPAYNWQQTTSGQFILGYSLHQNPGGNTTMKDHLDVLEEQLGILHEELCADAGYGSEENYQMLEERQVQAYVKYSYFHKEQSNRWQQDPFRVQNLHYNPEQDCYYCPMGQSMTKVKKGQRTTTNGFVQQITYYQARNCRGCPLRGMCHKSVGNRIIEVNHQLNAYRGQAKERLTSKRGLFHRSQRPQEVEAVFGHIKSNRKFNRLMLKGLQTTEIEIGLLSLAHNLRKKCSVVCEMVNQSKESLKCVFDNHISKTILVSSKNFSITVKV